MFGFSATTVAWIGVGVAAASAGMSAYSASEQADASKKAANYQAQVAANNAKIAQYQRSSAIQQGEVDAQTAMRQQAQTLSAQRAALASNGVDLTEGSSQDLLATTKFLGAADVNTIQSNAARQAWGYDVQGMNASASGQLDKWKADNINPAGIGAMAGASSLLSSASSYASAGAFKSAGGGQTATMKMRPGSW